MINLRPLTRHFGCVWEQPLDANAQLSLFSIAWIQEPSGNCSARPRTGDASAMLKLCRRDELDPTIYNAKSCRSYVFTMSRPRMHLLESVAQSYHSGSALFSTSVRNGITPGTSHLSHISSTLLWK